MKNKNFLSSNRSFGIVFFIVFLIFSFWNFDGDFNTIKIIPLSLSIIFLILGLLNSKILSPLNKSWLKIGELLGRFIAPLVMAIIYFIVITPLAITVRLFGKDLLNIKFNSKNTYWIKRLKNIGSMKKQF